MLQLIGGRWPDEWKPEGWTWGRMKDYEPFEVWWQRCGHHFPSLDERVLEQWVHRHWSCSPYFGFPLQHCDCSVERLTTETLISQLGQVDCWRDDPFYADRGFDAYSRLRDWQPMTIKGTWDMPILLVNSPAGFAFDEMEFPHFAYWLIEGHTRHDYLRCLAAKGKATADHEALVLRRR